MPQHGSQGGEQPRLARSVHAGKEVNFGQVGRLGFDRRQEYPSIPEWREILKSDTSEHTDEPYGFVGPEYNPRFATGCCGVDAPVRS
jgi:hypothetical protein